MKKLGVFICHCGVNIAGTVDVKSVAEQMGKVEDVAHSTDYIYMCSEPGQQIIREAVREKELQGVVVACCSPNMHENTFRKAVKSQGMNPYLCEIANIREQCSWVHQKEKEEATRKAMAIISATLEKVRKNESLEALSMAINRRVLVIGGGIAGITASLDLAEGGYEVILLERESALGGHMAQLSKTFPDLDPALEGLLAKASEVERHPNIRLHCFSELEDVKGFVGNFDLTIRKKATSVDWNKCNGCDMCITHCPVKSISQFERGLGTRKSIDHLYPSSIPSKPVIDREQCRYFLDKSCRQCEEVCPEKAIDFEQKDATLEEKVGAIIVATGYELYPKEQLGEYGYGEIPDVIDGLALERMLSPEGPTKGRILRPSDGKVPKEMVFIQCVASRDPDRYMPYCSRVCCMYTAKHAAIYKEQVPDGQPYIFYMDIRSDGKGYEEFVQKTVEEKGLLYLRGRVSRVFQDNGKVRVLGVDTLTGKMVEVAADMVVLATAIVPSRGIRDLADDEPSKHKKTKNASFSNSYACARGRLARRPARRPLRHSPRGRSRGLPQPTRSPARGRRSSSSPRRRRCRRTPESAANAPEHLDDVRHVRVRAPRPPGIAHRASSPHTSAASTNALRTRLSPGRVPGTVCERDARDLGRDVAGRKRVACGLSGALTLDVARAGWRALSSRSDPREKGARGDRCRPRSSSRRERTHPCASVAGGPASLRFRGPGFRPDPP